MTPAETEALALFKRADAWISDPANEPAAAEILFNASVIYGGDDRLVTAYVVREVLHRIGVSITLEDAASCVKP